MKKRSLVAAIAMLIVSAIVLTSSTYAWFASSSSASVTSITARIDNNNGAISVAAAGTYAANNTYKTSISKDDFTGLCTNFTPVDMNFSTTPQFNTLAYDTTEFKTFAGATENTHYLQYSFSIKCENAGGENATTKTVTLTPTFTPNAKNFTYGIISVTPQGGSTTYYMYSASGSYVPMTQMTAATITDSNSNAIVDSGDTGYAAADMGTFGAGCETGSSGTALNVMTVAANATGYCTVNVWVWAEGQDADCTGNVDAQTSGFSFAIA